MPPISSRRAVSPSGSLAAAIAGPNRCQPRVRHGTRKVYCTRSYMPRLYIVRRIRLWAWSLRSSCRLRTSTFEETWSETSTRVSGRGLALTATIDLDHIAMEGAFLGNAPLVGEAAEAVVPPDPDEQCHEGDADGHRGRGSVGGETRRTGPRSGQSAASAPVLIPTSGFWSQAANRSKPAPDRGNPRALSKGAHHATQTAFRLSTGTGVSAMTVAISASFE